MSIQQAITILCPECDTESEALIQDIVNGQDLVAKAAFLEERLNDAQCPQCRANITPTVPILYYDLEHEIVFVLAPPESSLDLSAQNEMIQVLTNTLINSLPTGQRKTYLFTPQRFDSLEPMIRAILAADGITKELVKNQAEIAKTLEILLQSPDEETLKSNIKTYDAALNYEFFELLTGYIHAAQLEGDEAKAQALFGLREYLGKASSQGKESIAKVDAQLSQAVVENQAQLFEKLQRAANNKEREQLVADGYSLLDFAFFQQLTEKIDRATESKDVETAHTLKQLRTDIIDLKTAFEQKSRAALEQGETLFREIIESEEPDQVMKKNISGIDESFFFVLGANIERARRQGQEEPAQAMEKIGQVAVALLQENQLS